MIWAAAVLVAALCAFIGWLLGSRSAAGRVQYVDTSGVYGVSARSFADVWRGKTLNFDIDGKHAVIVPHINVTAGVQWLERIQAIFAALEKDDGRMSYHLYREGVRAVYNLTKPFAKRGYKRALFKRAINDYVWFLDIVEQIVDFWVLVKKKVHLLATGATLRQTDGYTSTWACLKLEGGKRVIQPRYAS